MNDIIGATQYYVYRSTSSFSDVSGLTPIAQPLTSTYEDTLTVNGTYYYRIIATNGTHNTSLSDIVSVVVAIPPTVADQTVVISNIVPNPSTSGLIILEWNEIIGATTYYVYRHTSSFSDVSGLTPIAEIGGTAYYDTLTANGTYYYRVIASDGTMNSSISNEVSVIVEIPAFEDNQIFLNTNLTGITNIL